MTVRLGDQSVIGQTVTINGVAQSDGGPIGRIHWDWGDGTADEQSFPASHRFESLGHNYTVIAAASDDRGSSATAQTTVSIIRATCANDPSRESAVPGLIVGRPAWADDRANIRVDHSITARRTGQVRGVSPDERQVLVLDGPWCTEDFIWWHVESQAAALADGSGSIPQEGYASGRLLGWMAELDQEGRLNLSPERATLSPAAGVAFDAAQPVVAITHGDQIAGCYRDEGTEPPPNRTSYSGEVVVSRQDDGSVRVNWTIGPDRWIGIGTITEEGELFVTYTGASAGSGTWVLGSDGNLYGVWQYAGFSDTGTEVWLRSMPPEKGDAGPTPIPEPPGTVGGRLITKGGEVVLEILPSEAGFTNELWLFAPDNRFLGVTNRDLGAEVPLGSFAIGEELVFGIKVQNTGNEYATGPAERNPDGVVHAVTKVLAPDRVLVAFEDLEGGGDRDFNDLVFVLKGEIGGVDSDPLVLTSICTRG